MNKLTPENISEITKLQSKEMDLDFKESRDSKLLYVIVMAFVLIVVFGIIFLLKSQPDVMKEILIPIITMILGSVGGYGYGRSKRDD